MMVCNNCLAGRGNEKIEGVRRLCTSWLQQDQRVEDPVARISDCPCLAVASSGEQAARGIRPTVVPSNALRRARAWARPPHCPTPFQQRRNRDPAQPHSQGRQIQHDRDDLRIFQTLRHQLLAHAMRTGERGRGSEMAGGLSVAGDVRKGISNVTQSYAGKERDRYQWGVRPRSLTTSSRWRREVFVQRLIRP